MALESKARFKRVKFPGRAGALQDQGENSRAFANEVGNDYPSYHRFLRKTFADAGGVPDPKDYKTFDPYLEALAVVAEVLQAEAILRRALAAKQGKREFSDVLDSDLPLLDKNNQLVSAD